MPLATTPRRALLLRLVTAIAFCVVATSGAPAQSAPWSPQAVLAPALEGRLNMNTATQAQWELLPGIGPATATRIVAYREHRQFRHPTHLMRVKGIGRKTFARIRGYLTLDGETTLRQAGCGARDP